MIKLERSKEYIVGRGPEDHCCVVCGFFILKPVQFLRLDLESGMIMTEQEYQDLEANCIRVPIGTACLQDTPELYPYVFEAQS